MNPKDVSKELASLELDIFEGTGGACQRLPGRCEVVSCRYNLLAERTQPYSGRSRLPIVTEPCALRVAYDGPHGLETIAEILGCTRERVRQIQNKALATFAYMARRWLDRDAPRRPGRILPLR